MCNVINFGASELFIFTLLFLVTLPIWGMLFSLFVDHFFPNTKLGKWANDSLNNAD